MDGAFAVALIGFLVMHFQLLAANCTTIEMYEKDRVYPWPYNKCVSENGLLPAACLCMSPASYRCIVGQSKQDCGGPHPTQSLNALFDSRGLRKNWEEVFGHR